MEPRHCGRGLHRLAQHHGLQPRRRISLWSAINGTQHYVELNAVPLEVVAFVEAWAYDSLLALLSPEHMVRRDISRARSKGSEYDDY
jgi:hypothetical protein